MPRWFVQSTFSGWWFGTFFIFPYMGNVIIPTDSMIFQRGGAQNHQAVLVSDQNWMVRSKNDSCASILWVRKSHQWNPHFESRNISILDEDSSHVWTFNKSDQVVPTVSQGLGILPHSWIFRFENSYSYRFLNTTVQHYWLFIGCPHDCELHYSLFHCPTLTHLNTTKKLSVDWLTSLSSIISTHWFILLTIMNHSES